ncbi:MAG: hypothetical protein N4A35_01090 [Flavobacteriales bacterium]|jgi:outer membrane murein-binding lipoprotein Lpp|nr:hypothetical protein [Flavobacteriales bacterium]
MKHLAILLISSLLFSCSSKDHEALNEVEQLASKVDALEKQFTAIDHQALKDAKKQYDTSIELIKSYYFKDTVDVLFMNSLDFYKNVKTSTKLLNKNKEIIGNNFETMHSQLSILKEDIENTAIQGKQLKNALINENKNVYQLDSMVNLYVENADRILFVHDSIAGYIKNKTLSF